MTTREHDRERLREIRTFPSLVKYLRDDLGWPIGREDFDDLTFDYTADDLGLDPKTAADLREIKQLRPLETNQPWGIFFVSFEPKRLPIVALRRILGHLVLQKRQSADKAHRKTWQLHDLLFISTYGESEHRDITFAHFAEEGGGLPSLKVLGWDDEDTALHLDHAHETLMEKLRWPKDAADVEGWRASWSSAFELGYREAITTSRELAKALAHLATVVRKRVNKIIALESERGPLRKLMKGFRESLIHDLSEDDFADTYAQTIAYGLLTEKLTGSGGDALRLANPFLAELLEQCRRIGRRKGLMDFDELGVGEIEALMNSPRTKFDAIRNDFNDKNPQEDPVIHFYELFLKEYDPRKRMQRGVFYTPRPVVSYIVRSVDELLKTEFGLEDGLASTVTWGEMAKRNKELKIPDGTPPSSPFVAILDPACGTGTFLVEAIEQIRKNMEAKWERDGELPLNFDRLWNSYVPKHLLPRLFGYELMMAPYAIAHMKVGLKLAETGYTFKSDERARIYLTNSLEPPQDFSDRLEFDAPALAHEAKAVNEVKRNQRFTMVIGNPPYSIFSANMSDAAKAVVEQYRFIDDVRIKERGALKSEVILQDDYVKFLGFSQNALRVTGLGAVGMITNANCYQNPVLRGVRYALQRQFPLIHAADLGGQSKAGVDDDENVFEIDTSVAISIMISSPGAVHNRRFTRLAGSRTSKYQKLLSTTSTALCMTEFHPKHEQFLFMAFESSFGDEYEEGFPIDRAFVVTSIGIKTARDHLVLDFDKAAVIDRIDCLRNPAFSATRLRQQFAISDNTQWKFNDALGEFRSTYNPAHYTEVEARPFDRRWLYFHPSLVFNTRPTVNRHVHGKQNLCLLTMRRIRAEDYAHFFVVNRIGMGEIISSADNCNFFPLYLYHDNPLTPNASREPNFTREFVQAVRQKLGVATSSATPEDILHYAYAIFYSPRYRNRYAEFLKIDFPRIPLPGSLVLFRELAKLGGKLVALHLMESPKLERFITTYVGSKNPEVGRVGWSDGTVWLDAAATKKGQPATPGTIGFRGVPEEVWNFHIGGYQVCEKWLKDRKGRTLTKEDLAHYQKIVVALHETIRLMAEIDRVIESHGGWPAAFASTQPSASTAQPGSLSIAAEPSKEYDSK